MNPVVNQNKIETFSELFNIILTEDKDLSRNASKGVRKLLYSSVCRDKSEKIHLIIQNAPFVYRNIKEEFRQENFVTAVSVMYFLHDRDDEPDFLFPWLFELIQHKNGNIRYSAERMICNELGPLTYHIRCPGEKSSLRDLPADQADNIIYKLFVGLNNMAFNLYKPQYKKYKYINSLPTGSYKTIQRVLSEIRDDCGEDYMRRLGM